MRSVAPDLSAAFCPARLLDLLLARVVASADRRKESFVPATWPSVQNPQRPVFLALNYAFALPRQIPLPLPQQVGRSSERPHLVIDTWARLSKPIEANMLPAARSGAERMVGATIVRDER